MIAWFARNSVAANLLMITLLGIGLWSATTQLTLEVFPESDVDTVTVTVAFRGNSPEEVEEGIVLKIEEAIQDLEAIDEMTSIASESNGTVAAEIKDGYDPRAALDDIKARVDAIVTFPAEAEKPRVSLQEHADSVVKVIIAGNLDEFQLRQLADEVHEDILNLTAESTLSFPRWLPIDRVPVLGSIIRSITTKTEDITSATIVGVRPYEISIDVSEKTLLRYDLTLDEVATAVREQSVDLSGGVIKTSSGEILLRTKTRAYFGEQFESIVVRSNPDGTKVTLGDLGSVEDGFEEGEVTARFNGKPAVMVSVNRVGEQNAILISDTVKNYVATKQASVPPGIELTAWRDRSAIVEGRLGTLLGSAVWAGILVFLILALFLRISLSVWVVLGIPVAFAGALICMPFLGATINISSLFGFILVLGIVVDDAIVTGENIYEHLKRDKDSTQAAIDGTHEVTRPVIFGILTTIAAFVPLLMFPGHRGAMFSQIPAVVIPVLIFSLIESKLILPGHLKHLRNAAKAPAKWNYISRGQQAVARGLEWFIRRAFQPVLEVCLVNRWITVSVFVFILMGTLGWYNSGRIPRVYFPRIASEYVTIGLTMPAGTPYKVTSGHVDRMEAAAFALQKKYTDAEGHSLIEHIFSSTGGQGAASSGGRRGGSVSSGQTNVGEVSFEIIDPDAKEGMVLMLDSVPTPASSIDSRRLSMELRRMIGDVPGAEDFSVRAEIGRYGDPIDIRIFGQDPAKLLAAAEEIKAMLAEYPGLFDISANVDDGKEEIQLRVRPEAELLGIDSGNLARQTRGAFYGFEAQRIQRGREDIRVMVRYPREERESVGNLSNMRVRTPDGARVPFANVAELDFGRSPAAIRRSDRNRTVNVIADADKEEVDLEGMKESIDAAVKEIVDRHPGVHFSLEGEAAEQREANAVLLVGVFFVLFVIYCLLAIPFRSFLQPLMVMVVMPFGLIGAVFGHLIMGLPLSIMSMFGMLALAGVVVNDSLVLVDWINRKHRDEGLPLQEAVRIGGAARFRPIILTSLTTFAGLMPLIFEKSTQAQFLIPMAVSLGFGILFATGITLLLVPSLYLILEDFKWCARWFGRWWIKPFDTPGVPAGG